MKRIKKAILLLGPLCLALALGWVFQQESDFFNITENPVNIEFAKSHESLVTKIKPELSRPLEELKGKNIWKVSLKKVKESLESLPLVKKVSMRRQFPNKIETEIRLQDVIFVFAGKGSRFFPVLRSGEKLEAHKMTWLPSVPILRNNNIYKDEVKLAKTIELFEEIPHIGPLKSNNIAEVDYSEVSGLSLKLIEEKVIVHFGNQDIQTKALQVLRVVDYLKSQKHKARVIDASFTKKVLVRLRKRS